MHAAGRSVTNNPRNVPPDNLGVWQFGDITRPMSESPSRFVPIRGAERTLSMGPWGGARHRRFTVQQTTTLCPARPAPARPRTGSKSEPVGEELGADADRHGREPRACSASDSSSFMFVSTDLGTARQPRAGAERGAYLGAMSLLGAPLTLPYRRKRARIGLAVDAMC